MPRHAPAPCLHCSGQTLPHHRPRTAAMTFRFMPLCARPPCHLHRTTCREMCAADADEVCLPCPERATPVFPLPLPPLAMLRWLPFYPAPPPSRAPPQGAEPNCPSLSAIALLPRVLRPALLPVALLCSTSCLSCPSLWPPALSAGHALLRVCRIARQHVTISLKSLPLRRALWAHRKYTAHRASPCK